MPLPKISLSLEPEDGLFCAVPNKLITRTDITDHDGSMIALFMPDDVAEQLRIIADDLELPQDSLQELAENMHLTLAYFPDNDFSKNSDQLVVVQDVIKKALQETQTTSLQGDIQGYGVFNGGKDGPVLYASLDAVGLNEFRAKLCELLKDAGLNYSEDHGFTPHITLAYLSRDFTLPEGFSIPNIPVEIKAVSVVNGKQRYPINL